MSELTIRVRAEYQSAIECRKELDKVVKKMQELDENSSPGEIERLTKRYAELTAKYNNSLSLIGRSFAYMKEAMTGVNRVIQYGADHTKSLGESAKNVVETARKRLDLEENILKAMKRQRNESEKAKNNVAADFNSKNDDYKTLRDRLDKKYKGQDTGFYSKDDKDALDNARQERDAAYEDYQRLNAQIMVYDHFVEQSEERTRNLAETLKNMTTGTFFNDMVQQVKEGEERVNILKDTIEGYKEKLVELQDTEAAKNKMDDLQADIDKKKEEISDTQALIDKKDSLNKTIEDTQKAISGEEAEIARLEKQQSALSSSSAEYADMQDEINGHYEELAKNEAALGEANEELTRTMSSIDTGKSIGELTTELDMLTTSYDKARSIAQNDLINQKDIEEARQGLAKANEELGNTQKELDIAKDALTSTKDVYTGFADTVKANAPKVFVSEDALAQYNELSERIATLKKEITDMGNAEYVDLPLFEDKKKELTEAQAKFEALEQSATHLGEVLGKDLAEKVDVALRALYRLSADVRKSQEEVDRFERELKEAKQELADAKDPAAITVAQQKIDSLTTSLQKARGELSNYKAEQKDALKTVDSLSNSIGGGGGGGSSEPEISEVVSEQIKNTMGSIAAIAGIGFGLNELTDFFNKAKEWRTYFQDIESSMKVFLGSAEKGAEFTDRLQKYAYYNMFEFSDLAKASQQMISYGHDVDSIIPRLDQLSNVATGTHGSIMELVDAYNRAKATGVVDARGVQSWAVKGVMIRDELREMGETATGTTITFEQLNKVLDKVTGEGGRFHNLMGEMMNNISAEAGQLEDNLSLMFNEIGEKYEGVFIKFLKLQGNIVENRASIVSDEMLDFGVEASTKALELLADNWKEIVGVIKDAVIAYGAFKAVMITHNAIMKASAAIQKLCAIATAVQEGATAQDAVAKVLNTKATADNTKAKMVNAGASNTEAAAKIKDAAATMIDKGAKDADTAATISLSNASKGLWAVLMSNPLMLAATAVAGLVYAFYKLNDAVVTQEEAQASLNDVTEAYHERQKESATKAKGYIDTIKSTTASLLEQTEAYKELIKERDVYGNYSKEQVAGMSVEQIERINNEDDRQKDEERLRHQIEAAEQIREKVNEASFKLNPFATFGSVVDEVISKYKDLEEFGERLKEDNGLLTNSSYMMIGYVKSAQAELQKHLAKGASDGVVEGIVNGTKDEKARESMLSLVNVYANEFSRVNNITEEMYNRYDELKSKRQETGLTSKEHKEFSDLQRQIDATRKKLSERTEIFIDKVSEKVDEARERFVKLNGEMALATGDKRTNLEVQVKEAQNEMNAWQSILKMIEAGTTDTELVVNIKENIDDALLGDEKLAAIGKDYERIESIGQDVATQIQNVAAEYESLEDKSSVSLSQMLEDAGLTAGGIDESFSTAQSNIQSELNVLENKFNKLPKDTEEARKLELEITKKKEQLAYIDELKEQLKFLAKDPFHVKLNIQAIIPDSLRKIFKRFFHEDLTDKEKNTKTTSETAQDKGKSAQERIDEKNKTPEEKHTGAEWKKKLEAADLEEMRRLQGELSKPLGQKEYEEKQKQLDAILNKYKGKWKQNAQLRQKLFEWNIRQIEDNIKKEQAAENAAQAARIAAIENDGEREIEERKEQSRLKRQAIENETRQLKIAIYNQRKSEWEMSNKNKNKVYSDTNEGKAYINDIKSFAEYQEKRKEIVSAADKEISKKIGVSIFNRQDIVDGKKNIDDIIASLTRAGQDLGNIDSAELKEAGLSDDFIDKMKEGQVSTEALTDAINELVLAQKILNKEKNGYDSAKVKINANDDKKLIAERAKLQAEEQRVMMKERLKSMQDYFNKYGSFEQQRYEIEKKYTDDINNARAKGLEYEVKRLEMEKAENVSQLSFKNISNGIDWKGLFNGVATMSESMMRDMMGKLKAYTKTGEFQNAGAQNQKMVTDLMKELKEYLGSDPTESASSLAEAMIRFEKALENLETEREQERQAVQLRDEAGKKLEDAKKEGRPQEEIDSLTKEFERLKNGADAYGGRVAKAQKDVQVFGQKLNTASEEVVNYTSKLDVALKNASGTWESVGGFSDIQSASKSLSVFKGNIDQAIAESKAERTKNVTAADYGIQNATSEQDEAARRLAMSTDVGEEKILSEISSIAGDMTDGLAGAFSEALGPVAGGIIAIPGLILQIASAIKSFVTSILNSIETFLRLEWLSDLINSILDALYNAIDAIFDLPENIANYLVDTIEGRGGFVGNTLNRIASIFGLGGSDKEDHEDDFNNELQATNEMLDANSKALDMNTKAILENKDNKPLEELRRNLDAALENIRVDREGKMQQARAIGEDSYDGTWYKGWSDGYHSWIYERNDTNDKWKAFDAFNKTLAENGSNRRVTDAADIFNLTPEEIQFLMQFNPQEWKDFFRDVGSEQDPQEIKKWLEEYAETAGAERDKWNEWYQSITQISFDSLRDNFKSAILDMEKTAKDFAEDFDEMMRESVVEVLMNKKGSDGKSFTDKIKEWQNRWGEAVESGGELTKQEEEQLAAEYNALVDEAMQIREQVKLVGNSSDYEQQSAVSNSIQNITNEQADALVGIMTSQQILMEQIKQILTKWYQNDITTEEASKGIGSMVKSAFEKMVSEHEKVTIDIPQEKELTTIVADALNSIPSGTDDDIFATMLENIQNNTRPDIPEPVDVDTLMDMAKGVLDIEKPEPKKDDSFLNASSSDLCKAMTEGNNIAADSRDILAGMAIHVEEIRDGVIDTIIPRIKNIDNELTRLRKVTEER